MILAYTEIRFTLYQVEKIRELLGLNGDSLSSVFDIVYGDPAFWTENPKDVLRLLERIKNDDGMALIPTNGAA